MFEVSLQRRLTEEPVGFNSSDARPCMPPGGRGAGHIWYDFLHDVVPHRDRFNRKWDDKWFPKMGP